MTPKQVSLVLKELRVAYGLDPSAFAASLSAHLGTLLVPPKKLLLWERGQGLSPTVREQLEPVLKRFADHLVESNPAVSLTSLEFLNGPNMNRPVLIKTKQLDPAACIRILARNNPRRPETRGWDRWVLLRDGMTVGEYLALEGQTPALDAVQKRWPADELKWALHKGWIALMPANAWAEPKDEHAPEP